MYRSWAYILMIMATLAGVVGLLWPSPPVRTIQEIAMPARGGGKKAGRPAARTPSKPPRPRAAPPAPPVVRRMPSHTTSSRRGAAVPQNGMQPSPFAQLSTRDSAEPSRPAAAQPRPPGAPGPGRRPAPGARPSVPGSKETPKDPRPVGSSRR